MFDAAQGGEEPGRAAAHDDHRVRAVYIGQGGWRGWRLGVRFGVHRHPQAVERLFGTGVDGALQDPGLLHLVQRNASRLGRRRAHQHGVMGLGGYQGNVHGALHGAKIGAAGWTSTMPLE